MVEAFRCSGGQVGREVRGLSLVSDQGFFARWVRVRGGRGGDREGEGGYGSAAKEWSVGVGGCSVGEVGRGSAIAGLGLGGFSRQ